MAPTPVRYDFLPTAQSSRLGRNIRNGVHSLWYSEGSRLDYKPVNLKPLTAESVSSEGPYVLIVSDTLGIHHEPKAHFPDLSLRS